jgi:hypothetical protein
MTEHKVKQLQVIEENKRLCGLISEADVAAACRSRRPARWSAPSPPRHRSTSKHPRAPCGTAKQVCRTLPPGLFQVARSERRLRVSGRCLMSELSSPARLGDNALVAFNTKSARRAHGL